MSTIHATMHGSLTMSHVIPRRLFQTLKMRRWNCNVCGVSRKLTDINYVRLLRGEGRGEGSGEVINASLARDRRQLRAQKRS